MFVFSLLTLDRQGLPKKFTAFLGSRLANIETVSLKLPDFVSNEQLTKWFDQIPTEASKSTQYEVALEASINYPTAKGGGSGLAYWEAFPLISPQLVRHWQEDRNNKENFRISQTTFAETPENYTSGSGGKAMSYTNAEDPAEVFEVLQSPRSSSVNQIMEGDIDFQTGGEQVTYGRASARKDDACEAASSAFDPQFQADLVW